MSDLARTDRGAALPLAAAGLGRRPGRGDARRARARSRRRSSCCARTSPRAGAGVVLREVAGGFTLASDPASEEAARRLLAKPRTPPLTQAQAETLAIVAYLQPVSRPGDRPHPRRHLRVGGADAGRARPDRGVRPLALRRRDLPDDGAVRAALRPLRPRPAARPVALRPHARGRARAARAAAARPASSGAGARAAEAAPKFLAHGGRRLAAGGRGDDRRGPGRRSAARWSPTRRATSARRRRPRRRQLRSAPRRARSGRSTSRRASSRPRREPGQRPAVVELVDSTARLYPVGRLDADSTGLILLTNDGELANRLTHPRYEVAKTYRARLRRPPRRPRPASGCAAGSSSRTGRRRRPR